ncbi:MAG TPA: FAD-binding oxidoreductase [Actinomycetota bacterium]|nr:FAD-binding oxidoreductase [Actinomycetota bacterium]
MPERADVAIVGGGITGLALAWELARRGKRDVTVVERRYTGAGGSGRNVGRIRAMQLTRELAVFALAAQRKHERLRDELGMHTLFWRAGYAWVLYEPGEVERMAEAIPMLHELGIPAHLHGPAAAVRRLPVLRGGETPAGAIIGRDAIVHHDAAVYAYRKACATAGVRVLEGRDVIGILKSGDEAAGVALGDGTEIIAPVVVNATDGWAREVSAMAGVSAPNTPVRREVFVTEPSKPFMGPAISFYRPSEGWFNQTLRGELVAGVVHPDEPVAMEERSTFGFLRRTAGVLLQKAPRLGHLHVIRQWAGVYDMTPDRKPLVGPVSAVPGFVQANGYSGRGFALAPLVAELLAEWLVDGERPELLWPFDPDRFDGVPAPSVDSHDYYAGYRSESRE